MTRVCLFINSYVKHKPKGCILNNSVPQHVLPSNSFVKPNVSQEVLPETVEMTFYFDFISFVKYKTKNCVLNNNVSQHVLPTNSFVKHNISQEA